MPAAGDWRLGVWAAFVRWLRALLGGRPHDAAPPPAPGPEEVAEAACAVEVAPWMRGGPPRLPTSFGAHATVHWGPRLMKPLMTTTCPRCAAPLGFPVELLLRRQRVTCARCGLALDEAATT